MKWSIPERIVERGRKYAEEGRVLSVTRDDENKVWIAEVLGSEQYLVELDGSPKENDRCSCVYWLEHGYCKHTVAVELYLKKQGISRIMNNQPVKLKKQPSLNLSEMFTRGFSKLTDGEEEKTLTPYIVEFYVQVIETNRYYPEQSILGISLKIGYEGTKAKTYVIKNIGEFLQAYSKEATYVVNKQYHFELLHEAFSVDVQELLTILSGMYQTNQLLGFSGLSVKGKLDKRYLIFPIEQKQELLERLNKTGRFHWSLGKKNYRHVRFSSEELPIHFYVKKQEEDSYSLEIDNQLDFFFAHYRWGVSKQNLYPITRKQEEIYLTLVQLLKRMNEPQITYKKEELSDLFGTVLPLLEKIGSVTVAPEILEEINYASLETLFVFKKKKGRIDVRVDFIYGDTIFSTDKLHNKNEHPQQEIIRNIAKESKILEQLETFNYQTTETGFEKKLPSGEALFYFFRGEIPAFQKLGKVHMGQKLRELFLDAQNHRPIIEVSDQDSWLDVRFDVTGIEEEEIEAILNSLLRNDSFYTLNSGEILSFDSEEFYETSKVLTTLRQNLNISGGQMHVPKNQGLILENILEQNSRTHFSESFKQMVTDLTHPEDYVAEIPQNLNATLRSYQVEGFKWLSMLSHYGFGGVLADEMGLGKTLQTIAYLLAEKENDKQKGPALIVAPASLTFNWQAECRKFAPNLSVQVVVGSPKERNKFLEIEETDIFITSYASLRQDIEQYNAMNIGYLILDEAQMVKNSGTKTAKAIKGLTIPQRFALSGTPVENNLSELWSIFQLILPGLFPSKTIFNEMETEQIAKIIQPFILRREKRTVLKDLPEKIENNIYSVLTEEQKMVYLAYLKQMQEDVSQMDQESFKKNRLSILAGLTRLRQICCDPRLFVEDYQGGSGKVEQVKDLLLTAKANNRKVLLFSQFTSMLSILEEELAEIGLTTFYLRGSTKAQDRLKMVDAFNEGERDVFLISLKAGGTGLNLTGADTVILYDLWWNPAVEEQAASRAHRIGQKNVVEVWRMIAEGTVEEKMNTLQLEKKELFQKVIQGSEEQLSKLTEEDIRAILSVGE